MTHSSCLIIHKPSSRLIDVSFSLFVLLSPTLRSNNRRISASSSVSVPFCHSAVSIHLPLYSAPPSSPKAGQSFLAFQRYKLGADSALFSQEYTDPSQDAAGAPYTSFGGDDVESPSGGGGGGGQANSDGGFDGSGGYQRQDY